MTSLDRIEIEGYKSIRKLDLELRPLNILIGANGAGKSNFISTFTLLNRIWEKNLQLYVAQVGADALLHFGNKVTNKIEISFHFGDQGYSAKLLPTAQDSVIFGEERFWFVSKDDPRPSLAVYAVPHIETQIDSSVNDETDSVSNRYNNGRQTVLDAIYGWRVYHFQDTSEAARVKKTINLHDNAFLRHDASNLSAYLYMLRERHNQFYNQIIETVRLAAPFFDDFVLRPSPLNPDTIRLEWREKGSDAYFNANMLSDGTLRFICLATLLLQPNPPSTIIIDEPELGLHPYAITLLANLLSSAATKTQVIVSTQSVSLIDHFEPEDLIVVERENQESVFKRLSTSELEQWLESYSLGELWEKNVIGGRP